MRAEAVGRLVWVVLVSLGQSFEDGVDLLSDSCQSELKLVLEQEEMTLYKQTLHFKDINKHKTWF